MYGILNSDIFDWWCPVLFGEQHLTRSTIHFKNRLQEYIHFLTLNLAFSFSILLPFIIDYNFYNVRESTFSLSWLLADFYSQVALGRWVGRNICGFCEDYCENDISAHSSTFYHLYLDDHAVSVRLQGCNVQLYKESLLTKLNWICPRLTLWLLR